MIDLIMKEFATAEYDCIGENIFASKNRKDFWMVRQKEGMFSTDEIESIAEEETIKNLYGEYMYFEKCTSVLLLEMVTSYNAVHVIETENDPYFFKKYVIQYRREDAENLRKRMDNDEYKDKRLGEILTTDSLFDELKNDGSGDLKLLYSIAHKLPFVMIDVKKKVYEQDLNFDFGDDNKNRLFRMIENDGLSDDDIRGENDITTKKIEKVIENFLNPDGNEEMENIQG